MPVSLAYISLCMATSLVPACRLQYNVNVLAWLALPSKTKGLRIISQLVTKMKPFYEALSCSLMQRGHGLKKTQKSGEIPPNTMTDIARNLLFLM